MTDHEINFCKSSNAFTERNAPQDNKVIRKFKLKANRNYNQLINKTKKEQKLKAIISSNVNIRNNALDELTNLTTNRNYLQKVKSKLKTNKYYHKQA